MSLSRAEFQSDTFPPVPIDTRLVTRRIIAAEKTNVDEKSEVALLLPENKTEGRVALNVGNGKGFSEAIHFTPNHEFRSQSSPGEKFEDLHPPDSEPDGLARNQKQKVAYPASTADPAISLDEETARKYDKLKTTKAEASSVLRGVSFDSVDSDVREALIPKNTNKSPSSNMFYHSVSQSSSQLGHHCQEQQQNQPQEGQRSNQHKSLSRSQSHPLTTDEAEYSKYWRGDVTIIKYTEPVLPHIETFQPTSSLDESMLASPITRAIIKGDNLLVLECLRQGENPRLICSKTGVNYLHIISSTATSDQEVKWVPMVFQLSNAGIDVGARDKDGRTAVRIAIVRRLVQILAALLKCGADADEGDVSQADLCRGVVKSEMMETIRRLTPSYWSAIHDLTPFKVSRLVKAWSRVNLCKNGQTLIEYAKQNAKDESIVKLLLQNEASIELAHAVMAGDYDRARVLLCDSAIDMSTCDTSVKNNFFEPFAPLTLTGAAIKFGHSEVLKLLRTVDGEKERNRIKNVDDVTVVESDSGGWTNSTRTIRNSLSTSVIRYRSSGDGVCELKGYESVTSKLCTIL